MFSKYQFPFSLLLIILTFALLPNLSYAHNFITDPITIDSVNNPRFQSTPGHKDINSSPMNPIKIFPCDGALDKIGAGPVVKTYAPGGSYTFTVTTNVDHQGGSCQVSLSYDSGKTWKVIKSFQGNCLRHPAATNPNYAWEMPDDAPMGDALFAWTYFPVLGGGNEMYMNCAHINVAGRSVKRWNGWPRKRAGVKWADAVPLFVANVVAVDCKTVTSATLQFPKPGPNVEHGKLGTSVLKLPVGSECASGLNAVLGGGTAGGIANSPVEKGSGTPEESSPGSSESLLSSTSATSVLNQSSSGSTPVPSIVLSPSPTSTLDPSSSSSASTAPISSKPPYCKKKCSDLCQKNNMKLVDWAEL